MLLLCEAPSLLLSSVETKHKYIQGAKPYLLPPKKKKMLLHILFPQISLLIFTNPMYKPILRTIIKIDFHLPSWLDAVLPPSPIPIGWNLYFTSSLVGCYISHFPIGWMPYFLLPHWFAIFAPSLLVWIVSWLRCRPVSWPPSWRWHAPWWPACSGSPSPTLFYIFPLFDKNYRHMIPCHFLVMRGKK